MLSWTLTFLIVALIAAMFGFGAIATDSVGIAKVIFLIFLGLFLISLLASASRDECPTENT